MHGSVTTTCMRTCLLRTATHVLSVVPSAARHRHRMPRTPRPDVHALVLQSGVATARKARQLVLADVALSSLRQLLTQHASAVAGGDAAGVQGLMRRLAQPDGPWVQESAKLMWAQVRGGWSAPVL